MHQAHGLYFALPVSLLFLQIATLKALVHILVRKQVGVESREEFGWQSETNSTFILEPFS